MMLYGLGKSSGTKPQISSINLNSINYVSSTLEIATTSVSVPTLALEGAYLGYLSYSAAGSIGVSQYSGSNGGGNNPTTNWKSVKEFGHTFKTHGSGAKNTKSLTDRARSTGNNQGQWIDNTKAAEYLKSLGDIKGTTTVTIPEGLGQVITSIGEIVPATKAIVVPSATGIKTAYPTP